MNQGMIFIWLIKWPNFHLVLVTGNWAHALDPILPEDQMAQTETSILPNRYHPIKIK